ncbi:MAG: SDR family oxidoreductase [Bacteroidota bacterium]
MVILITGASSGIGLASALFLKNQGHKVYGTSRKASMGETRNDIVYLKMDITQEKSIKEAIDFLILKEEKIDVLVNNAGIGMVGSVEDSSVNEMQEHFDTNYYGAVRVMQEVLPHMRNRSHGKIINISSLAGLFGLPYRGVYSAAKAAFNLLTESMRMELLKFNIHAVVLCPGDFKTKIKTSRIRVKKGETSIYKEEYNKVYDLLNEELHSSGDPIEVGKLIQKIVKKKS